MPSSTIRAHMRVYFIAGAHEKQPNAAQGLLSGFIQVSTLSLSLILREDLTCSLRTCLGYQSRLNQLIYSFPAILFFQQHRQEHEHGLRALKTSVTRCA